MSRETLHTLALLRRLGNDLWLGEVPAFPGVAYLASSRDRLVEKLVQSVSRWLAWVPPMVLARHVVPGPAEVDRSRFELPERDPAWPAPFALSTATAEWRHSHARIVSLPDLGIDVLRPASTTDDEMREAVAKEALAALGRLTLARRPVQALQALQTAELEATVLDVPVAIDSPRQRARREAADAPQERVLPRVGYKLGTRLTPPAFRIEPLVARILEVLAAPRPQSVLLVGPSGVGKTAAVHELAGHKASRALRDAPLWAVSGSQIVAGQTGFGMWQERCEAMVREAVRDRALLYLGNLVELMGVGRSVQTHVGVASFLRPAIARGELRTIAECTPEQIPVLEREDQQLLAAFTRIDVEPPDEETERLILADVAVAPDSQPAGPAAADRTPVAPGALEVLRWLHRRYATWSARPGRPVRFLRNLLRDRKPGQTLGAGDVHAAFCRETGLPLLLVDPAQRLDLPATREWFGARVIGQPLAVNRVTDLLAIVKAGLAAPGKPLASLLFIGPTGVGKTELARALAQFLFSDRSRIVRFDMSEFADPLAVHRLVGVTSGEEGLLTARVREQPFAVILFDEVEKAHPAFFDLLLQVLGEGRLTDAAGRLADFGNCVVIMTSNLGAESYGAGRIGFGGAEADPGPEALRHFTAAVQAFFRPELVNRIDRIVPFLPLPAAVIRAVARREIELLHARDGLANRHVGLSVPDDVCEWLARAGFDLRYGARPLRRAVERQLLVPLADALNSGSGQNVRLATAAIAPGGAGLEALVKAAPGADGQPLAVPGSASGAAGGELATLSFQAATLRRETQALDRCPDMRDVVNRMSRLTQQIRRDERSRRRRGLTGPDPRGGADRTELELLKPLDEGRREVVRDAAGLEEETLLALLGEEKPDLTALSARATALQAELDRVLLAVFARRWTEHRAVTLAIFADEAETLCSLARGWYESETERGSKVEVIELVPHGKRPTPAEAERLARKLALPVTELGLGPQAGDMLAYHQVQLLGDLTRLTPDALYKATESQIAAIATTLALHGLQMGSVPDGFVRRQVTDPRGLLNAGSTQSPGLLLLVNGELALPRLAQEDGLHEIVGEEAASVGRVEVLPGHVQGAGFWRKSTDGKRRRRWNSGKSQVEDSLLDLRMPWRGRDLAGPLTELLDERLRREVRRMLGQ